MAGTSYMVTGSEITASMHHLHTNLSAAVSRSVPVRDASVGWGLCEDVMTWHIYRHQSHSCRCIHRRVPRNPSLSRGGRLWARHMNIKFMMESGDHGLSFTLGYGTRQE